MLYYNRIDYSEGIDANNTSESKECDTCCCQYFLDNGFNYMYGIDAIIQ